jgi:putative transposase
MQTLRDREGSFDPQIVKKRHTILNASLDSEILGLYGLGMS